MHPLVQDIERGSFDDVLDELHRAVKGRLDNQKLATTGLAIGDRCRFKQETRPLYLNTHGVEIVRLKDNGEVIVKPVAPGRSSRLFRVWPQRLEKVAA